MTIASLFMRAIQLAESGQHYSCLTVEIALAAEGYAEAFDVFKDDRLRTGISAICQKYWQANAEGDAKGNGLLRRVTRQIQPMTPQADAHQPQE